MDLNSFFIFDDAALDLNSAFNDNSASSLQDTAALLASGDANSNFATALETPLTPEAQLTDIKVSPAYNAFNSDDSGFETTINYYAETDGLLGKSPGYSNDAIMADTDNLDAGLTVLTAPIDPTFKYILDNQTTDNALAQAVPEIEFKTEPIIDLTGLEAVEVPTGEEEKVPYSSKSNNGKIELKIISQPSQNHRARYRTEGSRGAVKDRMGRSFPIVKLTGYNKTPVKLRCYIGHDKRHGEPHLFYQVSKIVGKNVTPCQVTKIEGIKVVEIDLLPSSNMQAMINCIGIVKERNFDVQRKATNLKKKHLYAENGTGNQPPPSKNGIERRSTACTLVFGCQIPETNEILQTVSDPINCAQLLGSPEVHKISATQATLKGGEEIFIIGKNFTRDTKLIWESNEQGDWTSLSEPESEFLNQNHLIVKVPQYTGPTDNPDSTGQIDVTFKIKCGDKYSEPYLFSYLVNPITIGTIDFTTWALK
ncbi:Nuclear factor of activated T-cells 5 [Halotydeus destructor]|nr:Nuclear factor of activated T-cells 5 [Halotydeus destructor]